MIGRGEAPIRCKDGSWLDCELIGRAAIAPDGKRILVSTVRNISERKRAELEIASSRDQALAASRAKSEFLSSMSHEIRTPMNAILGMADLMWETELSTEQRRYLDTVINNGNALLELINSILDLAKVESGRLSLEALDFDLRELIEKVADTLAVRADEKGVELGGAHRQQRADRAGRRSAAAAPGADQSGRQRDQVYRTRRGSHPGQAQSAGRRAMGRC